MESLDVNKIADYIIREYPKSCLAENGKDCCDLQKECENFFYFEKLQWCGCGSPEMVKREILKYFSLLEWWHNIPLNDDYHKNYYKYYKELENKYEDAFGVINVYCNPLLLAFAYTMDAAGLTEHGSSILGAWLTDEGKMFLSLLRLNPELKDGE